MKHAHHSFDIDQPGKDSRRHREAGAQEVMVASDQRWALIHELRGAPEPAMDELLRHMNPVDLVIVEGFKRGPQPKIEVFRRSVGKPLLAPADPTIVAIASDAPVPELALPRYDLDDIDGIASFIITHCRIETGRHGAA